jgi:YD repeat-containing protein
MKRLLQRCVVVVAVASQPVLAQEAEVSLPLAPESKGPQQPVEAWNGSFSHSTAIDVPAFRGLEPQLSLGYDSSRGIRNIPAVGGWLGVGWSLTGLSLIERGSGREIPAAGTDKKAGGKGVGGFGAAGLPPDAFSLDGSELVPCSEVQTPASSPSCAVPVTAGTVAYSARMETYSRIRYVTASNSWQVTSRDGRLSVYENLESGALADSYRWHLSSVTDLRGNRLQYAYSCGAAGTECLLDTISYLNQGSAVPVATVKAYGEARPDALTYGTGKDIRAITRRLRSIAITAAGGLLRAYRLTYEVSPATGMSRLASVQEFGRDATVGSDGAVSGGTALPASAFTYSGSALQFTPLAWTRDPVPDEAPGNLGLNEGLTFGDFNGDGRTDLLARIELNPTNQGGSGGNSSAPQKKSFFFVSDGSHFDLLSPSPLDYPEGETGSKAGRGKTSGDFDGDGQDELLHLRIRKEKIAGTQDKCRIYMQYFIREPAGGQTLWKESLINSFVSCTGYETSDNNDWQHYIRGDFNGDGRDDALDRTGRLHLGGTQTVWATGIAFSGTRGGNDKRHDNIRHVTSGDFNGDGRLDLLDHGFSNGSWWSKTHLGSAAGLIAQPQQTYPWDRNFDTSGWVVADANGDGLTDVLAVRFVSSTTYSVTTFLSKGQQFDLSAPAVQVLSGFVDAVDDTFEGEFQVTVQGPETTEKMISPPALHSGDFNGDGRVDLILDGAPTPQGGQMAAFVLSSGSGFAAGPYAGTYENRLKKGNHFGDFNGDGLTDYYDGTVGINMMLNSGPAPDLLLTAGQPMGGSLAVAYEPSSQAASTAIPFIMQTVKTLTLNDGRGWVSATGFSYDGGKWDAIEREFMGFQKVTSSLPCFAGETLCPKVVRTYSQAAACRGRVSRTENLDGSGVLLSEAVETFTSDTSLPLICQNTESEQKTYAGSASKSVKVARLFDGYGNVSREIAYGNSSVSGDESTSWTNYAANTAAYLVSCPVESITRAGINITTNPALAWKQLFRDGAATHTAVPTRCELTRERVYTTSTAYADTLTSYDAWGNVASQTDPVGNVTANSYDGAYHLFLTQAQTPLAGLSTKTDWDMVCGLPVKQAGFNGSLAQTPSTGEVTTTSYDALCRELRKDMPGGAFTEKAYVNFGQPSSQRIETQSTPAGGQSANRLSQDYLDGLGRSYWTKGTGPDAATFIEAATSYNLRGEVAAVTAPYYTGATPQWTVYGYDGMDRLTSITQPDGAFSTLTHGLAPAASAAIQEVTVSDEGGKLQKLSLDAQGKLVSRVKMKGATPLLTEYRRDLLGRITTVIDPRLAQWSYGFDLAGRRISVADPDLGIWSYIYDAAGRLVSQTDAKGQVSTLTYDPLSRVLTKTVTGAGLSPETTSNAYDEVRAGFFNLGKLTTASRTVAAQSVAGVALPAVSSVKQFDHDLAGRLVKETHLAIAGADRVLESVFWPDGSLRKKKLADGSWTGDFVYDRAGRLSSIGNANTPSAAEPSLFIQQAHYNAVRDPPEWEPVRREITYRLWTDRVSSALIVSIKADRDLEARPPPSPMATARWPPMVTMTPGAGSPRSLSSTGPPLP